MDNIFKISNDTIIALVRKLIDSKTDKCNIYETAFQSSKYLFSNVPGGVTVKVTDGQEQQYQFVYRKKVRAKQDNQKQRWEALKIDADDETEIYVEAVINDTCKTESVIQTPITFWSYIGIVPWKFSISNVREVVFPKYYISYGKTNDAKSKCEINLSDYAEIIAYYKHAVNEENRQRNINKQVIADRQNDEILNRLLESNKIEKKLC